MNMDTRIDGFGTIGAGTYECIKIDGVGKMEGDIQFMKMSVSGTCNAYANLDGEELDVDGILKVNGNIRIRELHVDGLLKSDDHKLYADEIHVDGMLKNEGEVNADKVRIDGCASLNDLFGDDIVIDYGYHVSSLLFGRKNAFGKINKINNIECSKLKAMNLRCHTISATDIVLEDHCVIDTVNCNGTLRYDSSCTIRHIEGDCLQQRK